jgi:transporter family-2 protein
MVGLAPRHVRRGFVAVAAIGGAPAWRRVYIGLFVTASSVASVLADHFGWLGFDQHTASFGRIAGCALMVAGIALVSLF